MIGGDRSRLALHHRRGHRSHLEPLIQLAPELVRYLAPGGVVILSGLLTKQSREVTEAYGAAGLRLVEARTYGDWDTLRLEPT